MSTISVVIEINTSSKVVITYLNFLFSYLFQNYMPFPSTFQDVKKHHWSYSASYFVLFTIALTIQGKHRAMCNFSSTQNVGASFPMSKKLDYQFSLDTFIKLSDVYQYQILLDIVFFNCM